MVNLVSRGEAGVRSRDRFVLQLASGGAWLARYRRRGRRWLRGETLAFEVDVPLFPHAEEDLVPLARQLATHLDAVVPQGLSLRLMIPAGWAFVRRVELPGVRWSEQAAGFAFEPFVPVELERLACATVRTGPDAGLVIAVFASPFRAFFAALEEEGIIVERMAVDVFGLARGLVDASTAEEFGILMLDRDRASLASSVDREGRPRSVSTLLVPAKCASDQTTSQVTAAALLSPIPDRLRVVDRSPDRAWKDVLTVLEEAGIAVEAVTAEAARDCTLDACAQTEELPDLRRGALAARGRWEPVIRRTRRCAWAAALVLLALLVRLHRERGDYARANAEARPVRDAIYTEVFPDAAVTAAAPLLLRSERIKLEGVTESAGGPIRLGLVGLEALDLLGEAVERVPADMKLDLREIALDDQALRLVGRTTSHDAAGLLVKSLNATASLAADPPQTKLLADGTVQFRVVARTVRGDNG